MCSPSRSVIISAQQRRKLPRTVSMKRLFLLYTVQNPIARIIILRVKNFANEPNQQQKDLPFAIYLVFWLNLGFFIMQIDPSSHMFDACKN